MILIRVELSRAGGEAVLSHFGAELWRVERVSVRWKSHGSGYELCQDISEIFWRHFGDILGILSKIDDMISRRPYFKTMNRLMGAGCTVCMYVLCEDGPRSESSRWVRISRRMGRPKR